MEPVDESTRVCAVCGRVLEQHRLGQVAIRYDHANVDRPADHPPVPVKVGEAGEQVRYRCDFCLAEPITHTLVVERELSMDIIDTVWDTEWAMCHTCTDFVLADDWLSLRRHAFAQFEALHGVLHEELRVSMRIVYRDLRKYLLFIYTEGE